MVCLAKSMQQAFDTTKPYADPLPRFKPLVQRRRGDVFVQEIGTVVFRLMLPGALLSLVICFALGLFSGAPATIFLNPMSILGLGAILAAIFGVVYVAVAEKLKELDNWRYVRSFEDIASYRPLEGVV